MAVFEMFVGLTPSSSCSFGFFVNAIIILLEGKKNGRSSGQLLQPMCHCILDERLSCFKGWGLNLDSKSIALPSDLHILDPTFIIQT